MVASLVVEHGLPGAWVHPLSLLGSEFGLCSGVSDAPRHVDLLGPGVEPASPALAADSLSLRQPGKPRWVLNSSHRTGN